MKCMQKGSAKQAGQPAEGALDCFFRRGRNGLVGKFGTVGVLHRPIDSGAGGGIRNGEVAGEAKGLAAGLGHDDHVGVAARGQLTEVDLVVQCLEGEAGSTHLSLCGLHDLVVLVQDGHLHTFQRAAGGAVGGAGKGHAAAGVHIDRIAHAFQPQVICLQGCAVVVGAHIPVAGRLCNGHAGAGERDAAGRDVPGRVGTIEHAVRIIGQQHGMGLRAVVQDDAFRVLSQQLDEQLGLFLMIGGQGRISHLHLPVCKAVGQTIGPGRGAHTVFRHIHPVGPSVKVSAAAQHHGSRSQRAGAAPALLEVEPGIHIQVHSQCCGQTGECKHDGEQNAHQFFMCGRWRCGIHGLVAPPFSGIIFHVSLP